MDQPSELKCVKLKWRDDVAVLSLSRPESLNALSAGLIEDIKAALEQVVQHRPRIRALVITGEGKAFCAGGDISAHVDRPKDVPYDLSEVMRDLFNPLLMRLVNLPIPFVTAVNGAAAGAGFPLSLFGDIVLAGKSARFSSGFSKIALMPDLGLSWLLPRLIGRARAHSMLMLDQRVTGEQAADWGMVNECVDDDQLLARATEVARLLAAGSLPALIAIRRSTLFAMGDSLPASIEREAEYQRDLGFSDDFQEGIAAFFGKRPAKFTDY